MSRLFTAPLEFFPAAAGAGVVWFGFLPAKDHAAAVMQAIDSPLLGAPETPHDRMLPVRD